MSIVPSHKFDFEACDRLFKASNNDIKKHLPELLEWLQDMNWPVARLVLKRIKVMNKDLAQPIKNILNGGDGIWKYYIITNLISEAGEDLVFNLRFELQNILLRLGWESI